MENKKPTNYEFRAKYLIWLLPGPLFYILYRLSFDAPEIVENIYSRGIFSLTNQVLSIITGLLPFSLGEFILYAFVMFVIVFIIVMIVKTICAKSDWWKTLLKRMFLLISICSFIYAMFIGLWAFNYARQPLFATLELDASPATVLELYETSRALSQKAEVIRKKVEVDKDGVYKNSKRESMITTTELYNTAAEKTGYKFLGGSYGRAKPVLNSIGLSHLNISGIYFPFTAEPNLNIDVPDLFFASAALHEGAHQRGFAREDEANFLGYYVASYSDDVSIEYSGTMLGLVHTMNKLYGEDKDLYYEIYETYSDGMKRDLLHNREYWKAFEGKASEVSEKVNDTYLKSNMQEDGVKSYGRMVDLLIGLWRAGEL